LQGRELVEKLRGQESRSFFELAVAEDPDFAVAHLQLAGVQPSAKGFFECIEKARALAETVSEAERLWILGFVAGALDGDPMGQRKMYQQLVDEYPDDERAHNLLATNYFGQQEWDAAVTGYEEAIRINPEYSAPYNQLGYALRFLERYDDAEKAFRKYMELIPDDPNPYDSYAELLMKVGRFDESIAQYEAALAVRPDFVASRIGIASDLVFLGRHEDARKQLQVMYERARDDGQRRAALAAMAFAYIDEGEFDRALETYAEQYALAEAIADTSAMAGDLALMAFALVEVAGREKEALAKFETSTAMVQASSLSEETKAQNRLGFLYNSARAYVAMGDLKEARANAAEYRRRVETARNPAQIKTAHQLHGLIALAEDEFDVAVEELLQSNLQNPYNHFHLALAYEGRGDRASAKRHYETAATFNALNNSPQAAIRQKAVEKAAAM
jgi:tetratricopeptide (TPR) repeat protein